MKTSPYERLIHEAIHARITDEMIERVAAKVLREARLVSPRILARLWKIDIEAARREFKKPIRLGARKHRLTIREVMELAEARRVRRK